MRRLGPLGGGGGEAFDDLPDLAKGGPGAASGPRRPRLTGLVVWARPDGHLEAIQGVYPRGPGPRHGGATPGGKQHAVSFKPGEASASARARTPHLYFGLLSPQRLVSLEVLADGAFWDQRVQLVCGVRVLVRRHVERVGRAGDATQSFDVPYGRELVALHGAAGGGLDRLGFWTRSLDAHGFAKLEAAGGAGGADFDDLPALERRDQERLAGLAFRLQASPFLHSYFLYSYDRDSLVGLQALYPGGRWAAPHGSHEGREVRVELDPSERIRRVEVETARSPWDPQARIVVGVSLVVEHAEGPLGRDGPHRYSMEIPEGYEGYGVRGPKPRPAPPRPAFPPLSFPPPYLPPPLPRQAVALHGRCGGFVDAFGLWCQPAPADPDAPYE
eukprot:tig00000361_g24426.t1